MPAPGEDLDLGSIGSIVALDLEEALSIEKAFS